MAYYSSNGIIIFPSSNATDTGKTLNEDNISKIVKRITDRNYILTQDSFTITSGTGNITISSGYANIQGYSVVTTASIVVTNPENNGVYIIGLRLRRDIGTNNVFGDNGDDNVGIDANFFLKSTYSSDNDILNLAEATISSGTLTIVSNPDILYRIDNALYSKSSGGILNSGNTYVIDQNLRKTDNVEFNSVSADSLSYISSGNAQDVKTVIDGIRTQIKNLKGTTNWDTNVTNTIEYLNTNKVNTLDVVTTATPNKILKMNGSGKLPVDITGNAETASSSNQSAYSTHVGSQELYYDINQNLRKTDNVQFASVYLGQGSVKNLSYANNRLTANAGLGGYGLQYNGSDVFSVSYLGNVSTNGTITGTRVYNAVFNDYAEFYEKDDIDEIINPGDIIEVNPDTGKYRICTSIASNLVVGVCSDNYGHILGGEKLDDMENNKKKYIPVGLSGKVYVNVEDGVNIFPGQLVISSYSGKAMLKANPQMGTVIGKAVGKVEKIDGIRKVLIQIMLR